MAREQFRLRAEGELSHFVKKNGSLSGVDGRFPADRSRAPVLEPKSCISNSSTGQRAAIDRQEFFLALGPGGMDCAGEQLLARARLADEQDIGVRDGYLADRLLQICQNLAGADDLVEIAATGQLAAEDLVLNVHLPITVEPLELVGQSSNRTGLTR